MLFRSTDTTFKNIDSRILLSRVMELIEERNYAVGNADISLILEKPKIKPFIDEMKNQLAPLLKISAEDISIKATTNEKLGYVGREEGVAAYAVVLIQKVN